MSETQADSHAKESEDSKAGGNTLADDDESVQKEIDDLIENPPENLEDWPDGKAKYKTLGGGEHEEGYGEGGTKNLGPHDVRYHEDGKVTVGGEEVENPDDFKNEEPIQIDMHGAPEEIVEDDDSTQE